MKPILELDAVGKRFDSPAGAVDALREVTLSIREGEFVALTGPSGSGKTTLLNLAGLLDRPTRGRVRFLGRDVHNATAKELAELRKHHVGTVYQQFHLLPHRSALDNVLFRFRYVQIDPAKARQRALAAIEQMGLTAQAGQPARVLSGGEMQRVAIARAMVIPPRLLIADEPTGNLDAKSAATVMHCFENLHAQGHTVLLATHNESLLPYATRHLRCVNGYVEEGVPA